MRKNGWTPEEIDFLRNNCNSVSKSDILAHMSPRRTIKDVEQKIHELGLKPRYNRYGRIGERYGHLEVIKDRTKLDGKCIEYYVTCRCDCGNITTALLKNISRGKTTSCGCVQSKLASERFKKHGLGGTRLYYIWFSIRALCHTKTRKEYPRYGGRGIKLCKEWLDVTAFRNWSLANGYANGLRLNRLDKNGNFEPSNCKWM